MSNYRRAGLVCSLVACLCGLPTPAHASVGLNPIASHLDRVTSITHAGDGSGRLFITLQKGLILVRDADGVRPTPFLDMQSLVSYSGEKGLLGLAFPPNYETSRRFYVHYVDKGGNVVIAQHGTDRSDPNVANLNGGPLLVIPQPFSTHKGGQLQFGPDGYLYVGVGDGGGNGDPEGNGQNLGTLLGKILRLDVSGASGYSIPSTNPFVATPGARPEIWAYGLRNPWKFSFDRLTGEMWIADVGEFDREEINLQPANTGGRNYGWRRSEGTRCFDTEFNCETSGLTMPVMEYPHSRGCSVTGGYRYRGSAIPFLTGMYLFADFCTGVVWASRMDAAGAWGYAPVNGTGLVSTFGEDESGELYVAEYGPDGEVSQITMPILPTHSIFTIGDVLVTEGQSGTRDARFTVLLQPPSPTAVSVAYRIVAGSADSNDYENRSGRLTLAPGTASVSIAIPVHGDILYEQDETFVCELYNPVGAPVGWSLGYGTIGDDDTGISISGTEAPEGGPVASEATFSVLRYGVLATTSVDFATADGMALAGVDYVASSGTLTFGPGQQEGTIRVPLIGDILVEPDKAFSVKLSKPVGGSLMNSSATATIRNDDAGPDIRASDISVAEGDAGAIGATSTVTLSYASEQTVTANYRLLAGTAQGEEPWVDFEAASGQLIFPPGVTMQTVDVRILGDLLDEADETALLALTEAVNGTVRQNSVVTILDNDPEPVVNLEATLSKAEGDLPSSTFAFPLTLSGPSGRRISVPFTTSPLTATEGSALGFTSFQSATFWSSGTASFYPLTATVTGTGTIAKVSVELRIYPLSGQVIEPEALRSLDILLVGPQGQRVLLMSDVAAGTTDPFSVVLTFDDDGPALAPGPLVEGSYRPTNYDSIGDTDAFPAPAPAGPYSDTLSVFAGLPAAGQWRLFVVGDGTGAEGRLGGAWRLKIVTDVDYVGGAGQVTFFPGQTIASAQVAVNGDISKEPDEAFAVDLGTPDFAGVANGHAVGTILNDDELNFRVRDVTLHEGDGGTTAAVLEVFLDQPGVDVVTVDYATLDGSATTGDGDYVPTSGTLTFAPGETTANVTVTVVGDSWREPDESFKLVLANPDGADIVRGTGAVALLNDDPLPEIAIDDVVVREGESAVFTVSLSALTKEPVNISYTTEPGTATNNDYVSTTGVLAFPQLSRREVIEVPVPADSKVEPSESFFLHLTNPAFASLADDRATGWILDPKTLPRVQFSAAQFKASEAARTAVVNVRRTGDAREEVRVDYRTTDGSARAGLDYTPVSGTLTFPRGAAAKTFLVPLLNDPLVDGPRTVLLDLRQLSGPALMGAPETAVLTLTDDDRGGTLRFGKPLFTLDEAGGQATIHVVRGDGAAGGVSVDYATADESATAGLDYQTVGGTLQFGPGVTSQSFSVPVLLDSQAEGQEGVRLSLSNPEGGAALGDQSEAELAIQDAQPTLEFAAPTFGAREKLTGVTITVSRSGPLDGTASVSYATSDGSAVQGVDYLPSAGVLTFDPGVTSRVFVVSLLNNRLDQAAPTVLLGLSSPTGAALGGQATAVLTLEDDDSGGLLQFGAAAFTATDGASAAVVTVTRTGGSAEDVEVAYSTADGTATAGVDYVATSGVLSFGAGVFRQTFSVPLLDGGGPRGDETVVLNLADPTGGAVLGARDAATLTLLSRDPVVQFSTNTYRAALGAPGATVTVTRSGPVTGPASVDYATSDGTATAGQDYLATSGTLSFDPGVKVRTFDVPLLADLALEPEETVYLALSNPSGGAAVGKRGIAVLNLPTDDAVVQWARPDVTVGERTKAVVLSVRRSGSLARDTTVPYATQDGSATGGSDYAPSSGSLTFKPGAASQAVRIPIVNDAPDEGDESFQVVLGVPGPGALLGPASVATVRVVDDDQAGTVELLVTDWSVRADRGEATITVVRTKGAAGDATIDYATGDGTGSAGVHYAAVSGTLVFGPGERTKAFSVPIFVDPAAPASLNVGLTLSNPGGGAALGPKGSGWLWIVKP